MFVTAPGFRQQHRYLTNGPQTENGTFATFETGPRFKTLLAVEEHRVTDGRMFRYGAIYSRQTPLPLMFLKRNTERHGDSVFVGNITRVWREGNSIFGEGEFDTSTEAQEAVRLVAAGKLNGVSIDTIPVDYEFLIETVTEDDEEYEKIVGIDYKSAELIGATIVPFPAFSQTYIRVDDEEERALVAAALDPVFPSIDAEAFNMPEPDEPTPWTVDGDRVYGHLAIWGECHNAINDRCVLAPRSQTNYANFLIGELGNERLGTVTMNTIHAGIGMTRNQVERHYADTGTVSAVVKVTDGQYGPWVCGTVDPYLSDKDRLHLALCGISGDWRGGELIGILACPKPGYTVPRFEDDYALVASAMQHFECVGCDESEKAATELETQIAEADAEVQSEAKIQSDTEVSETIEDSDAPVEEVEPTVEDLEEVDEILADDLDSILDDVLDEIEYRRFLELVG